MSRWVRIRGRSIKVATILGSRYLALEPEGGPGSLARQHLRPGPHRRSLRPAGRAGRTPQPPSSRSTPKRSRSRWASSASRSRVCPRGAGGDAEHSDSCRRSSPTPRPTRRAAEKHRTWSATPAPPASQHRRDDQPGAGSDSAGSWRGATFPRDDASLTNLVNTMHQIVVNESVGEVEQTAQEICASSPTCWPSTTICCADLLQAARSSCAGGKRDR